MARRPFIKWLAALGGLALLASCAEQRSDRSFVSPNALSKELFNGEWYFRGTVIDVPYGTTFSFIGEQSGLEKVRWDIQEDYLFAYRSYEHVTGSDRRAEEEAAGKKYKGAPLAAYRIKGHFDIRRDYNPTTGEETNVIVENTTDRPWYEQEYFRIDWSQNLVTNWGFLFTLAAGATPTEPVPYYVQDPESPDYPVFSENYMEFTGKIYIAPTSIPYPGYGELPLCLFFGKQTSECQPSEIKLRYSFKKVDPNNDYEPMNYTEKMQDRYGYFHTDTLSYDEEYGVTHSGRRRRIGRWNLWAKSRDENGKSIPYKDREVKPIVYYVNQGFPEDLFDETKELVKEWDVALRQTIRTLWRKDGLTEAEINAKDTREAFILCHNPVRTEDLKDCGEVGLAPRNGDLRYSFIFWVDNPQSSSPLGYGPASHDPETGEAINGTAYIYGAALETYSTQSRDLVKLLNGDIPTDDFIEGINVHDHLKRLEQAQTSRLARKISREDVESMVRDFDMSWFDTKGLPPLDFSKPSALREQWNTRISALLDRGILESPAQYEGRLDIARKLPISTALIDEHVLAAHGLDPKTPLDDKVRQMIRPMDWMRPGFYDEYQRFTTLRQTKTIEFASDFTDDSIFGLAKKLKGEKLTDEEMRAKIRSLIYKGVTEHEVGHTMGLRHNFAASTDALNFFDAYWENRVSPYGENFSEVDSNCLLKNDRLLVRKVGRDAAGAYAVPQPRMTDQALAQCSPGFAAKLAEQNANQMREEQYSSIMDYGAKFNSDFRGLGRYDYAAIKFGYGGLVEVFGDKIADPERDARALWSSGFTLEFGYPFGVYQVSAYSYEPIHYSQYPNIFGEGLPPPKGTETGANVKENQGWWKMLHNRDHVFYDELVDVAEIGERLRDKDGRIAIPYRFCSDELAGNITCNRWDEGADPLEIMNNVLDSYQSYYVLNNFARDRYGFGNPLDGIYGYIARIKERYLQYFRTFYNYYILFRGNISDEVAENIPFLSAPNGWGSLTVAVSDAFNLMIDTMTMPQPGKYYTGFEVDGTKLYRQWNAVSDHGFNVDYVDGRIYGTNYDFGSGYYWFEKIKNIGFYYDKILALGFLTDPATSFLGRDTQSDIRSYTLNLYRTHNQQINRIFGDMMAQNNAGLGRVLLTDEQYDKALKTELADPVKFRRMHLERCERYDDTGMWMCKRDHSDRNYVQPAESTTLSPDVTFSVRIYAAILGMAFFPNTFDRTFLELSRVWNAGSLEELDVEGDVVTYVDDYPPKPGEPPRSGRIFVAKSFKDDKGNEIGIGARMIQRANLLKEQGYRNALNQYIEELDIIRTLTAAYTFAFTPDAPYWAFPEY